MPPKKTKRGFKSVSTKTKQPSKENLVYEDVEDEHTITPKTKKSKFNDNVTAKDQTPQKRKLSPSISRENNNAKKSSYPEDKSKKVIGGKERHSPNKATHRQSTKTDSFKKPEMTNETPMRDSKKKESTAKSKVSSIKTYYPKIHFDQRNFCNSMQNKNSSKKRKSVEGKSALSSKEKAASLIAEVCSTEKEGLQEYFSTHHSSRDKVLLTLSAVIDRLPGAFKEHLSALPDDAIFEPELPSRDHHIVESRVAYLQDMELQLSKLKHYAENLDELGSEFGLSGDGTAVLSDGTSMMDDMNFCSDDAEKSYVAHLDNVNNAVGRILKQLDVISSGMSSARTSQDELFEACQKVRFAQQLDTQSTSTGTPIFVSSSNFDTAKSRLRSGHQSSAKDTIKKLQRL